MRAYFADLEVGISVAAIASAYFGLGLRIPIEALVIIVDVHFFGTPLESSESDRT